MMSGGPMYLSKPNFLKISEMVFERSIFLILKMVAFHDNGHQYGPTS